MKAAATTTAAAAATRGKAAATTVEPLVEVRASINLLAARSFSRSRSAFRG
jgi:hypothetical protein